MARWGGEKGEFGGGRRKKSDWREWGGGGAAVYSQALPTDEVM